MMGEVTWVDDPGKINTVIWTIANCWLSPWDSNFTPRLCAIGSSGPRAYEEVLEQLGCYMSLISQQCYGLLVSRTTGNIQRATICSGDEHEHERHDA